MAKLEALVKQYCEAKNLMFEAYMEGMLSKGKLSKSQIDTLISYHKEWLKK